MRRNGFFRVPLEALSAWADAVSPAAAVLDFGCCMRFLDPDGEIDAVASPRHGDVLIVSGALNRKAAPLLRRYYDQMPDPKTVLAVGTCVCGSGPFAGSYAIVADINEIVPVDVFVQGCPPTREDFLKGLAHLKKKRREKTL